jgi:hypothetical protein
MSSLTLSCITNAEMTVKIVFVYKISNIKNLSKIQNDIQKLWKPFRFKLDCIPKLTNFGPMCSLYIRVFIPETRVSTHRHMATGGHGLPKVSPGPPCPTFLRPAGGPPLKWSYNCFRAALPAGHAACGRLLPLWTPHAVRLCLHSQKDGARRGHDFLPGQEDSRLD